jgi:hypothetical protein
MGDVDDTEFVRVKEERMFPSLLTKVLLLLLLL